MMLFQYAIILNPSEKEKSKGEGESKLLVPPTYLMAQSEQTALLQAARAIPKQYMKCLERIEVAVRPF